MRESMSVRWSSRCSVAWGWEGWQPAKPRIGIGKSLKGRPRIGRLVQPVLQVVSSDFAGGKEDAATLRREGRVFFPIPVLLVGCES